MRVIRKISIGPDVLNAMNYTVGQPMLKNKHRISDFKRTESGSIEIWLINNDEEVYVWKEVNPLVPVTIEYNIDF